ncbi:MAG: hypothetical protein RIT19_212 [Verrucomicrobiota bacterium]
MNALIAEFRAIPWTARGRKVGRTLTGTLTVLALTSPGWIEPLIFGLIGR